MNWIVFSYSLPTKPDSRSRVALWRRLRRIGAIAPKSGVYVLPDREDCLEAFQWLAQEVQQAKGESVVMKVEKFEGLPDSELIKSFSEACKKDYDEIHQTIDEFEKQSKKSPPEQRKLNEMLEKIQSRFNEVSQIDFFDSSYGKEIATSLVKVQKKMSPSKTDVIALPSLSISDYKNKEWVTRPRPHVDRLACAWLIRRFINQDAKIRYSNTPEPDEIPFDTKGALFGHYQNRCSFETIVTVFHLEDTALRVMGEIIHEIDLRDAKYFHAQTEGIASILKGWIQAKFSDEKLEEHGIALFEGLYTALSRTQN